MSSNVVAFLMRIPQSLERELLVSGEWLASNTEEVLTFPYLNGRYLVSIGLYDCTDTGGSNVLECRDIEVDICPLEDMSSIWESISVEQYDGATLEFGNEILNTFLDIRTRVLDYFQNSLSVDYAWRRTPGLIEARIMETVGQKRNGPDCQRLLYNFAATLITEAGDKHPFKVYSTDMEPGYASFTPFHPIKRELWLGLKDFVVSGKRSSMRQLLILNSQKSMIAGEFRVALIEAVIALEITLEQTLGTILSKASGTPGLTPTELDKLVEKLGLSYSLNFLLRVLANPLGLSKVDISTAIEAVERRNLIVHKAQRRVPADVIAKYLEAIDRIIKALESWSESQGEPQFHTPSMLDGSNTQNN